RLRNRPTQMRTALREARNEHGGAQFLHRDLEPHRGRSASWSWRDSVVDGKLGVRAARWKNGCGQACPRIRHPRTMRMARAMSRGLSPVDPSGAVPIAYVP